MSLSAPTLGSVSQHWISTVAGRFGIVNDRWLVYGKLGGGWIQSSASLNVPSSDWNRSNTDGGLLIGGRRIRLQGALDGQTRVRLSDAVKLDFDAVPLNRDVQMIKAGINYKFEAGVDPASEVSK